jgi:hypothetical protein
MRGTGDEAHRHGSVSPPVQVVWRKCSVVSSTRLVPIVATTPNTSSLRTRRRLAMHKPDQPIWARKYRLLAAAVALIAAILFLLTYAPNFGSRRPPTESERVFSYFAESLGEASLCEKISWAAFQSYSWLFAGGGASFARSDCYQSVAVARHAPAVCWNVRPLVDVDLLSAGYSALSCWRRVARRDSSRITLAPETLIRVFAELGYDVDQLHLEGVIEPAIRPADVYRGLEREPEIVDRVQQALARSDATLPSDDKSFLAHLAAVTSSDARWCDRIPAHQALATEEVPFRDWCYMTVAFNTQDARICERMTPAAAEVKVIKDKSGGMRPDIAEQLSARAQCARIDKWIGPPVHHGPEVPQDPLQTQRLIATLGHDMPRARDWPPYEIAAYYSRFLDALQTDRPADPRREAASAKLIGRITTLPEIP